MTSLGSYKPSGIYHILPPSGSDWLRGIVNLFICSSLIGSNAVYLKVANPFNLFRFCIKTCTLNIRAAPGVGGCHAYTKSNHFAKAYFSLLKPERNAKARYIQTCS